MIYPSRKFSLNNTNNICKENNYMVARVSVMVLRIAALLALILGILFWVGVIEGAENLRNPWTSLHMTLGIIVTICLVILGYLMITTKGGNAGLGIGAIFLAILVIALGLIQTRLLPQASVHWIIQVVHLLFGLLAIGLGEMIGARHRRLAKAN
jgi:hypothetical protein